MYAKGIKAVVLSQYRDKVNQAAMKLCGIPFPPEGWLCTVRKALGMSVVQLARRLGKTRALISHTEKAELNGSVTLRTMHKMAKAMECRFVYAIVPQHTIEDILEARAKEKAEKLVEESSKHMGLEQQLLSREQMIFEIKRLNREIIEDMQADFWNDEIS